MESHQDLTLSFVIPFYSGLDYLREAIQSASDQDVSQWRLIVCDDAGPEPEAAEIVASFNDARISYERNSHTLGLAGNWNRCLELVDTDMVTILHADDKLMPDYARLMLKTAAEYPKATALCCAAHVINAKGRPCRSIPDIVKKYFSPKGNSPVVLSGEMAVSSLH